MGAQREVDVLYLDGMSYAVIETVFKLLSDNFRKGIYDKFNSLSTEERAIMKCWCKAGYSPLSNEQLQKIQDINPSVVKPYQCLEITRSIYAAHHDEIHGPFTPLTMMKFRNRSKIQTFLCHTTKCYHISWRS